MEAMSHKKFRKLGVEAKERYLMEAHEYFKRLDHGESANVVKALKISLLKWVTIANGSRISIFAETCPMCGLYIENLLRCHILDDDEDTCEGCPLGIYDAGSGSHIYCTDIGHPWHEHYGSEEGDFSEAWTLVELIENEIQRRKPFPK